MYYQIDHFSPETAIAFGDLAIYKFENLKIPARPLAGPKASTALGEIVDII